MHQLQHPKPLVWNGYNCAVQFEYYSEPNDRIAIRLIATGDNGDKAINGEPITTASVNLPDQALNDREVYIVEKGNAGLMLALMDHKILNYQVISTESIGDVEFYRCKFNDDIELPEPPPKEEEQPIKKRSVSSIPDFMQEIVDYTQKCTLRVLAQKGFVKMHVYGSEDNRSIIHTMSFQGEYVFAAVLNNLPDGMKPGHNQIEVMCNGLTDPDEIKKAVAGLEELL